MRPCDVRTCLNLRALRKIIAMPLVTTRAASRSHGPGEFWHALFMRYGRERSERRFNYAITKSIPPTPIAWRFRHERHLDS